MKYLPVVVAALVGLSSATPLQKRQDIDFDAYEAVPQLPDVAAPAGDVQAAAATYTASVVAEAAAAAATSGTDETALNSGSDAYVDGVSKRSLGGLYKRSACATRTPGTGPAVHSPDTASAFQAYPAFSAAATASPVPVGYNLVVSDALAAAQDPTYMTYTILSSYNVATCEAFCQANQGCNSFNIYFERDPVVEAGISADGQDCSNPESLTYIKCAIFGGVLTASSAKNVGQFQSDFEVVIAGSNIYAAAAPKAPTGFTGPYFYNNATISSPSGYITVQTFPQTQPYDPSVCATACNTMSDFDRKHGLPSAAKPDICNFFVSYILYKNGGNGVFTCTYYTSQWSSNYAKNSGQWDSQGNHYTIGNANGFAIVNAPQNGVFA